MFGDRLHLWLAPGTETRLETLEREISELLNPSSIRQIQPSLEDVYIARLSDAERQRRTAATVAIDTP